MKMVPLKMRLALRNPIQENPLTRGWFERVAPVQEEVDCLSRRLSELISLLRQPALAPRLVTALRFVR